MPKAIVVRVVPETSKKPTRYAVEDCDNRVHYSKDGGPKYYAQVFAETMWNLPSVEASRLVEGCLPNGDAVFIYTPSNAIQFTTGQEHLMNTALNEIVEACQHLDLARGAVRALKS